MTMSFGKLFGRLNHTTMPLKIKNTSWIPDNEAKLLIRWALRYVEITAKRALLLRDIRLTNSRYAYSGRAWPSAGRTLLRIGKPIHFPQSARYRDYKDFFEYTIQDYQECLVMLAAHEFWHHARKQVPDARTETYNSARKSAEHDCEMVASDAINAFRKERQNVDARLLKIATRTEAWNCRARDRKASRRSPEARLEKSERYLKLWQRKARMAENKVKKYQRSVTALRRALKRADQRTDNEVGAGLLLAEASASTPAESQYAGVTPEKQQPLIPHDH